MGPIVALCFISLMILVFSVGTFLSISQSIISRSWIEVDAVVIKVEYRVRGTSTSRYIWGGSSGWIPTVEYQDEYGNKFRKRHFKLFHKEPVIGATTIKVKYDPKKHKNNIFVGEIFWKPFGMVLVLIFFISMFVLILIIGF